MLDAANLHKHGYTRRARQKSRLSIRSIDQSRSSISENVITVVFTRIDFSHPIVNILDPLRLPSVRFKIVRLPRKFKSFCKQVSK